jgi:hypothetical protein
MSLTTLSVQAFLEQLAENKINIDACTILNKPQGMKLKNKKKSEQKSNIDNLDGAIYFGDLVSRYIKGELPLAIKVFPDPSKNNDDSNLSGLVYEGKVYKYIYENIIKPNYSPNFVSFVASACCSNETCITITERVGSGYYFGLGGMYPVYTLGSIFQDLLDIDKMKILFQIFYSLELMQRFGIVHYDFHQQNILVVDFVISLPFEFFVEGEKFSFYSRYVPYLFDWDFSYCEPIGDNPKLYEYTYLNMFNKMSKKADLYTLLCVLYESYDYNEFYSKISKKKIDIKEKSMSIDIPERMAEKILKYQPYAIRKDNKGNFINIYKFSKKQLDEIFERDFEMNYAILELNKDEKGYFIQFRNPFLCRNTMIPKDFPTPLELIKTRFIAFKRDLEDLKSPFSYTMPEPDVKSGIFIDPFSTSKEPLDIMGNIKNKKVFVKTRKYDFDIPLKKAYY